MLCHVIYSIGIEKLCVGRMNICSYTSVLAYGTKRFLSCDDLVIVVGAGGGMSSVGI